MTNAIAGSALAMIVLPFCFAHPNPARAAESPLELVVSVLNTTDDPALHRDVLRGIQEALAGRRDVPMPRGWPAVYRRLAESSDVEVRETATALAVVFGDPQALAALRKVIADSRGPSAEREKAIRSLVQKRDRELVPILQRLVGDPAVCGPALRGLAAFDDEQTPRIVLERYTSLPDAAKQDAIGTLSSRATWAAALLDAVESERLPRGDLSAFTVRQLAGLNDEALNKRLEQVWGTIRPASEDKAQQIARYKRQLTPETLGRADLSNGRRVYSRTCASCHKLFDDGREVGPELTGSQRHNLDYILENILDPSAVVGRDYQMSVIVTDDGRVLTGIVQRETDAAVTLATANDTVVIPRDEIEERERSPVSMMPEGILNDLTPDEIRDLIAYLASPTQVPLPEGD
jgi:putative heme-binding domain-containing protein